MCDGDLDTQPTQVSAKCSVLNSTVCVHCYQLLSPVNDYVQEFAAPKL